MGGRGVPLSAAGHGPHEALDVAGSTSLGHVVATLSSIFVHRNEHPPQCGAGAEGRFWVR